MGINLGELGYKASVSPSGSMASPSLPVLNQEAQAMGQFGGQLMQTAGALEARSRQYQEELDQLTAFKWEMEFGDRERDQLDTIRRSQGLDAIGVSQNLDEQFYQQEMSNILEGGYSDRQRQLLLQAWGNHRNSGLNWSANHEAQQMQVGQMDVIKGVAVQAEQLTSRLTNYSQVDDLLDQYKMRISQYLPDERANVIYAQNAPNIVRSAFEKFFEEEDYQNATSLLNQYRTEISEAQYSAFKQRIEDAQQYQRVAVAADTLWANSGYNPTLAMNAMARPEELGIDPEDAPGVARRISIYISAQQATMEQEKAQYMITANTVIQDLLSVNSVNAAIDYITSAKMDNGENVFNASEAKALVADIEKGAYQTDDNVYQTVALSISQGNVYSLSELTGQGIKIDKLQALFDLQDTVQQERSLGGVSFIQQAVTNFEDRINDAIKNDDLDALEGRRAIQAYNLAVRTYASSAGLSAFDESLISPAQGIAELFMPAGEKELNYENFELNYTPAGGQTRQIGTTPEEVMNAWQRPAYWRMRFTGSDYITRPRPDTQGVVLQSGEVFYATEEDRMSDFLSIRNGVYIPPAAINTILLAIKENDPESDLSIDTPEARMHMADYIQKIWDANPAMHRQYGVDIPENSLPYQF
jgi:hypothetical protein